MNTDTLIVIPTYNEIENIEKIIGSIFKLEFPFHILVVDDNSPDGTSKKVEELIQKKFKDKLFLIVREKKAGIGPSYIEGFRWGIKKGYNYLCQMDADLSHNPTDVVTLRKSAESDGDYIIGSRYIKGITVVNWPLSRILISYLAVVYANFILGLGVKDVTSGFSCIKSKVLQSISLEKIHTNGYGFQVELKYRAKNSGFKLTEQPIIFKDREFGVSKLGKGIIFEALINILKIRILKIFGKL